MAGLRAAIAGRGLALALAAAGLGTACGGGEPASPEAQIAAVIERFETAAGERDVGAALDLLSEDYLDAEGRDKQAMKGLVLQYFLGHEAIHVLSRIRRIELGPRGESAHVVVAAALTGAPVADPGELETLSADLFRFELEMAREGDTWRVRGARWRRGQVGDFF